jgi:hypothetical protein
MNSEREAGSQKRARTTSATAATMAACFQGKARLDAWILLRGVPATISSRELDVLSGLGTATTAARAQHTFRAARRSRRRPSFALKAAIAYASRSSPSLTLLAVIDIVTAGDAGRPSMDCCSPVAEVHAATLTLWAALGVGLTTSLGHCLGMCGPLISTFSLAQGRTDSRLTRLVPGLLLYHLGRLNAYALIGALFGLLMTVTHTEGPSPTIRAAIFGFSGTLMVLMGLGLGGWLPTGHLLQNHRLGQFIAGKFMALAGTSSMAGRYFLGVANGFLPCGPVYAMAAATLTAPTPLHGAGTMAMFGLGTVPVLLAVGLGAGRLAPALQRRFNLAAAILVVFMGLEFLFRAGKLVGLVREIRWGFVPLF